VGIYDRDYYRQGRPGLSLRMPQSMVVTIIIINAALWLINGLFFPENNALTNLLSVSSETLKHPWLWWQFLTYGFVHSPQFMHVFFNMLQLWFLGMAVEQIYGSREFLRIYLVMLLLGSIAYVLGTLVTEPAKNYRLLGASGAVSGVVILFVLNMPHATLMLFPIPIPIKAWIIGVLLVVGNLLGSIAQAGNVAYGVHLTGILFAFLYFQQRWNLGRFLEKLFGVLKFRSRPRFRIHDPDNEKTEAQDLSAEVDRILEKISHEGESSLSRKERRTLETASRQYQKKRD
jgi:membrane associated rhomboid family serine protease